MRAALPLKQQCTCAMSCKAVCGPCVVFVRSFVFFLFLSPTIPRLEESSLQRFPESTPAMVGGAFKVGSLVVLSHDFAAPSNINASDGPLTPGGPPGFVAAVRSVEDGPQPILVCATSGVTWWYVRHVLPPHTLRCTATHWFH